MWDRKEIESLQGTLANADAATVLEWAHTRFGDKIALATSLSAEDQVITHLIAKRKNRLPIFTLDTGRHFEETQSLLAETRRLYELAIDVYMPSPEDVEAVVSRKGPDFFKNSVADRRHCCFLRKVKPLQRALAGYDAWITGLRREQSDQRGTTRVVAWDEANNLLKINPLWSWETEHVWRFIREHKVPFNPLHDQGFPSIGCAPCTRAVAKGEHPRAGRWWWETEDHRECGIHIANGKVVRRATNAS